MGRISDNFAILYPSVVAAVYLKPEYTMFSSKIATVAILFAIITISKLVYQLYLYPQFFTPFKSIPTPKVS